LTFDTHEKGRMVIVDTHQVEAQPGPDPRGDFDFLQTIFDSPRQEKVYGMGLQYTETNFKGKNVQMISSEGGVGRGLAPLTQMLNDE
jgi:hypothetical protein